MARWRDLVPASEEVILASNGTFLESETGKERGNLGFLVLTKSRIYIIHSKGLMLSNPKMEVSIPLHRLKNLQNTGKLVRALEFDYQLNAHLKHVKFMALDYEVRELLEEIEYLADNI